ncbi:MAG: flagellar hook-basal body protein [Anaerolineales bacterium]|nr:flagellar hook-basal body protein [Anaerolineales bacterium]
MIKGIYAAASAMVANLNRQSTLSHNIANMDTPGFKQILISLDDFMDTSVLLPQSSSHTATNSKYIGELGLGTQTDQEKTDFSQGGLRETGEELDFAINGEGFFRVMTPDGERYTRDGRFVRDIDGNLVTVDGYKVLDESGAEINIPLGTVSVVADGTLQVDGTDAGKIGIASFVDPQAELTRDIGNTFIADGAPTGEEFGSIQQGYLEMSNANSADLMTQMVAVARAYEAAQQLVSTQDELLSKTMSYLGRYT